MKELKGCKVGVYLRLSRDDGIGESMSIEHQRIILQKFVTDHGGNVTEEYIDDGWSGTSFERPGITKLLSDAQAGKIDTVIVKDLSRFGRNYIQVGQYIDYIFPAYGIRFIAINDNVDTSDRQSAAMDMMPIMNVFNEWHAANTSKKIRAVLKASWSSGKYTNWNYCFGYKVGTDNMRTAIIDEPAAEVVKTIFDLRLQGNSYRAIARVLSDKKIPNPTAYFRRFDGQKSNRQCSSYWNGSTVKWILSNPTYIGCMVQHKTTRISYKNHRAIKVPQSEQIVKENAHKPIIDLDVWQKVREMDNGAVKGRADKNRVVHTLSGMLICADCGRNLKLKRYSKKTNFGYYCGSYIDLGKKYCSSHSISEKAIMKLVMDDIRSMLTAVNINEEKAKEQFLRQIAQADDKNKNSNEYQIKMLKNRLAEIDKLIQTTYEDRVLNKVSEELCIDLCEKYRLERKSVEKEIATIEKKISEVSKRDDTVDEFIRSLRAYGSCQKLTREMCLQLIAFITVGENRKHCEKEIHIYYKFINNSAVFNDN